jgi:hypothetical protein
MIVQGDGQTACPLCKGRGVVSIKADPKKPWMLPSTTPCACVKERDICMYLDRCHPGLSEISPVSDSTLISKVNTDLRIISSQAEILSHLAFIIRKMGRKIRVKFTSDFELMRAWLYNIGEKHEIFDHQVRESFDSKELDHYSRVEDLAVPPDLLVIQVGVKTSRNQALPEVFLEALSVRKFHRKPTWVVEAPEHPLSEGHICYSPSVGKILSTWPYHRFTKIDPNDVVKEKYAPSLSGPAINNTFTKRPSPKMEVEGYDDVESDLNLFGSSKSNKKKFMGR